ncbi:thymidylate kinase-domain-containing protein [Gorgonomyces haynaldii]|nr:thymidylate kinase-domain-containing protein [Gorgonomyces haynaldii]
MTKRGLLIAIEGADRSGKSTQIELIRSKIVGSQVLKFPDRTTATGKIINEYLQMKQQQDDHAIHLLFSANRWEAMPRMRQLLSQGTTLVLDRYCYSGVAYSAAKGLDWNWCAQPDIGLLKPDVVFYLNIDPSLAS